MAKWQMCAALLVLPFGLVSAQNVEIFPELSGNELIEALRLAYKPTHVASYNVARDSMYMSIYYAEGGVECFYTGLKITVDAGKARLQAQDLGFDTEHIWPQSKFSGRGNAYSDLHHLRPNRALVNQSRSNYRFRFLDADEVTHFWRSDVLSTSIPDGDLGSWSKTKKGTSFDTSFFEPRDAVKGDVARALFYFYTMYEEDALLADRDFFETQREWLRQFHRMDPTDSAETSRTWAIAAMQDGKPNPFILDSTLVRRAFFTNYQGPVLPPVHEGRFEADYSFSGTASCVDEDDEPLRQQIGLTLGKMRREGVNCNLVSNAFNSNGWPESFSETHFVGFRAEADSGYQVGFAPSDSLRLFVRRSATGPSVYRVVLAVRDEELVLAESQLSATSQNVEVKLPMPRLEKLNYFELRVHAWGAASSSGTFRLASLELKGSVSFLETGTGHRDDGWRDLPERVRLYPSYPNPFNPTAILVFEISVSAKVRLEVLDVLGRQVAVLLDEDQAAGLHRVHFEAADLASGVYFARFTVNGFPSAVHKMALVR